MLSSPLDRMMMFQTSLSRPCLTLSDVSTHCAPLAAVSDKLDNCNDCMVFFNSTMPTTDDHVFAFPPINRASSFSAAEQTRRSAYNWLCKLSMVD